MGYLSSSQNHIRGSALIIFFWQRSFAQSKTIMVDSLHGQGFRLLLRYLISLHGQGFRLLSQVIIEVSFLLK